MPTFLHCPHCGGRMESTDRNCRYCGSRRSVAVTGGSLALPPPVADASDQALATELQMTLHPGIIVLRELGRGGMGLVYLAREPALRRLVVIKVLAPELAEDATARARFRREAEAAAAVAHPNVVAVYQAGELPRSGTAYLVMQFIDGPTLAEEFPAGTVAPEARARRVMAEVAAALAAAHGRGLIHRDIKPANIMLERETGRAIVLDFGVSAARHSAAHRPGPRITQEGVTLGTPVYMSPEQAASEPVTDRSDVYSLGIVMFELVTGRAPFDEKTPVALAAAHLHKVPPPVESLRPDLEPEFAGLIDRCLSKQPERRPDAASISRALMPGSTAVLEWPPPGLARLHGAGRRTLHRFRLATAAACAYVIVLAWLGTAVAGPGWLILSAGVVALALGLNLGAERTNGRMLRWLSAGRQAGYPIRVLLDVALDHTQDSGALIGGSGMFALVSPPDRLRWQNRRRTAGAVRAIGMALAGVVVVLWVVGWIDLGPGSPFRALTIGDAVVLFLPWLIAEGLAAGLTWPELRIRLAVGRRPENLLSRLRAPVIRRDLVEGWLMDAGATILTPRSKWGARFERIGWGIWTLPAVALALALVVLTWSTAWNQHNASPADAAAWNAWWQYVGSGAAVRTPWQQVSTQIDSALVGWGNATPDTIASREMINHSAHRAVPAWADVREPADTVALLDAWAALPAQVPIPPFLRARLARDTSIDSMSVFRRAARNPLTGAPGTGAVFARIFIGASEYRFIEDYAFRDAAAGALALAAGNIGAATDRAHEVLGAARPLLFSPNMAIRDIGLGLASLGGQMLARVGAGAHDRPMADRGRLIEAGAIAALDPKAHLPWPSAAVAAAELDPSVWTRLVGNRAFSPAERWLAVYAVAEGTCWNQREVMIGPSTLRNRTFAALGERIRDLPGADSSFQQISHLLDWIRDPRQVQGLLPSDSPFGTRMATRLASRPMVCDQLRSLDHR